MSTDNSELYGVFAATGKQGSATAQALLEQGVRVRALVRRPESEQAGDLAARGAEVVLADLDRPETLGPAMDGLDALWFMTTMNTPDGPAGEAPMAKALGDAAVEAGVGRLVFSSVDGAERNSGVPHFDSKYDAEQYLQGLPIGLTVVRPVFFMENLPYLAAVEDAETVLRMPLPDGIPLQMVAVRDVGRVAAAALLDPADIPGGAVGVAGDELTGTEIASVLGAAAGMPGRYEALPLETLAGQADSQAMFRWFGQLPAYQGDFEATNTLARGALDLDSWLVSNAVRP
ncbi:MULTISPECIES: NmrA/HSCARG family protein [unclassified Arthrobacter]|uniref:NmrA/HSCARG family protein n=1 Tax=unclassified Arthrobacter TaxID=235627 RepID=UPI001D134353|nr:MULTISPECIES: NmrA/HSCARG family protein [unclassified Arthrobacter]MCC3276604.1 NmrA/HSCARG family protein [Arthrobacter sp. zg-Y20]MCC9178386.1 NmrA/HSCARG family protein [Arthrobacter sp. zg-Y750]MDK1316764.1 NmrA/HSCARG family protein [Arthrobacter sp. zg.Y20]WIB06819.1 NmrA/HSCARG family protein [Arthrobacter sp. zg-Y20]